MKLTTLIALGAFLSASYFVSATHIRGGELSYENISGLTYQFTFVGYRDQDGVLFGQGRFDFGDGTIFGDEENETIPWEMMEEMGGGLQRWEFILTHTYSGAGAYIASYTEDFRSDGINNISNSVNSPFHLQAFVVLDPTIPNSSFKTETPPNFTAISGEIFNLNQVRTDPEGDSLTYRLIAPLSGKGDGVDDYLFPNDSRFYDDGEPGLLEIDQFTGNLTWEVPDLTDDYTFVLKVDEWRNFNGEFVFVGYSLTEVSINVRQGSPNLDIRLPEPSCNEVIGGYNDQVVIQNFEQESLTITFFTDLEGLQLNGLSVDAWNEESEVFESSEIIIDVSLTPDAMTDFETLNKVMFHVISEDISSNNYVSETQGFIIGLNCDVDFDQEFLITGLEPQKKGYDLKFFRNRIEVAQKDDLGARAINIYDSSGKKLMTKEFSSSRTLDVFYEFEPNKLYLVHVVRRKGFDSHKILFTEN